ncbi:hypothetical protein LCL97_02625 [Seohaeicola saemankumensis]|nr:hypothetical protein [Seohaeicola saemankumensis]MCA0869710.1 hypothetical protein [Seohaeicola saemankumensis]
MAQLEGQIAALTQERNAASAKADAAAADLAACGAGAAGSEERVTGLDGRLATCEAARTQAESDVELWRGRHGDAEADLIRVRGDLAAAQAEHEGLVARLTALREARHETIMVTYDGVIAMLERLQKESSRYSNESSPSAQRAFRNDVQDRLTPVESYRYEFGEVQRLFNSEITELMDDLQKGTLTEPEALQRRIEEALKAFDARRAELEKSLQILDAGQAAIIGK